MKYDTQRPYAASYAIIRNNEGFIAFVLRSNTSWMNGFYSLPAGKTEVAETFIAGAIREASEEVGVTVAAEDMTHVLTVHRYSSAASEKDGEFMEWIDVYFEVHKYAGDIYNAEPHMHSEVAWLDPNNLPDNVIPAVLASIKALEEGKRFFEYGYDK